MTQTTKITPTRIYYRGVYLEPIDGRNDPEGRFMLSNGDEATVGVVPYGESGVGPFTVSVWFTMDHPDMVEAGTCDWYPWAQGDITSEYGATDVFESTVTAIAVVVSHQANISIQQVS